MNKLRPILGLLTMLIFGWLLLTLIVDEQADAAIGSVRSSAECRDCHSQVYDEWEQSGHASTWDNEDVRALSKDFSNKDCIDCHSPKPVFSTGIGNRVLPRSSRRSEGVDCIACHLLPGGGVAGTIESDRAACRPTQKRELQRADFCGVCHNQHKTVDQWRKTPYAEEGTSCIDCHMPYRDGDVNKGRHHGCRGAHDLDFVRSAVTMEGTRQAQGWLVEIANVAAGHAFPTDERSRAADLFWRPVESDAAEGSGDWRFLHRIRDPYRHEIDIPSTLLHYGEKRSLPIDGPDATGAVEVVFIYRRSPYYHDPVSGEPLDHSLVVEPLGPDAHVLFREVYRP